MEYSKVRRYEYDLDVTPGLQVHWVAPGSRLLATCKVAFRQSGSPPARWARLPITNHRSLITNHPTLLPLRRTQKMVVSVLFA
jgi:hypothetical protein